MSAAFQMDDPCEKCFGTGAELVPGKGMRPCSCRVPAPEMLLARAEIPDRYQECSFETYKPIHESQVKALMYASTLAKTYPVERGLLLVGPAGVGKTHLATSALRVIALKGYAGLFIEFGNLLKQIQKSYDRNSSTTEWQVLSAITEISVLVLDELGASRPTDWARDILYQVINARYNKRRLTIVTSNFIDEPKVGDESLAERIGEPLRSRLYEMCKTVNLGGEDYRRRKDRSNVGS